MPESPAQRPPSERQLAYARGLGIQVPENATGVEVSDLLTTHEWGGQPADPVLQELAAHWGVAFTRFTCLEDLHDRITRALVAGDADKDLAAWFAFNVARDLGLEVISPADVQIQEVAAKLAADPEAMRSVRRKGQASWIRFGDWKDADAWTVKGASRNTAGYKAAAALIRNRYELADLQVRAKRSAPPVAKGAPTGCLSVLVAFVALTAVVVVGHYGFG